jgi:hypothetical protein
MQGKKFPVDVFKVLPAGPAASHPPAVVADYSKGVSAEEDTSAPAADLIDRGGPSSPPQALHEQAPIIGRQVALQLYVAVVRFKLWYTVTTAIPAPLIGATSMTVTCRRFWDPYSAEYTHC